MRSSGGGGNVNGGDSAVAHVADGVVGGGKAVVSTLFLLELHTTLTYSRGTSSISGVGGSSQTAPPRQATSSSLVAAQSVAAGPS